MSNGFSTNNRNPGTAISPNAASVDHNLFQTQSPLSFSDYQPQKDRTKPTKYSIGGAEIKEPAKNRQPTVRKNGDIPGSLPQPAFHQHRDVYPVAASPMPFASTTRPMRVSIPLSLSIFEASLSETDGSYAYPSLVQSMSSSADQSNCSLEQLSSNLVQPLSTFNVPITNNCANADWSLPRDPVPVRTRRVTNRPNKRIFGYDVPSPVAAPKRTKGLSPGEYRTTVASPGEYCVNSPMQSPHCRAALSNEYDVISPMPPSLSRANVAASSEYYRNLQPLARAAASNDYNLNSPMPSPRANVAPSCDYYGTSPMPSPQANAAPLLIMPPWRARVAAPSECGDESVRDSTFSTQDESSDDDGSNYSTDDDDSLVEAPSPSDRVVQKEPSSYSVEQKEASLTSNGGEQGKISTGSTAGEEVSSKQNNCRPLHPILPDVLPVNEGPLPHDVFNKSQANPSRCDTLSATSNAFLDPFIDDLLSLNKTTFDMYLPHSVLSTFNTDRTMNDTIATVDEEYFDKDIFDNFSEDDESPVSNVAHNSKTCENDVRTNVADVAAVALKHAESGSRINIPPTSIQQLSAPADEYQTEHEHAASPKDTSEESSSHHTCNVVPTESAVANVAASPAVSAVDNETGGTEDTSQKKKSKRSRTAFNAEQLVYLEEYFKKKPYLERTPRATLSIALNLSERQIKIWFQNRRMRAKNDRQNNQTNEGLITEAGTEQGVESSSQRTVPVAQDSRSLNRMNVSTPMGIVSNQGAIQNGEYGNNFVQDRAVTRDNAQTMNSQANYLPTGQQFVPNNSQITWLNNKYLAQIRQGTYQPTLDPTTNQPPYTNVGHVNNSCFPPRHPAGLQNDYYTQSRWIAAPTDNPAAVGNPALVANQAYWPQYRN